MTKNAVVLISGGLDSLVSIDIAKKEFNIKFGLNFNYGQKAFVEENEASLEIAKFYNFELKTLELPFLKDITSNALTDANNCNFNDFNSVWIPNRNGLFINIAASYCDKFDIENIIFGANLEEAQNFCDNSDDFIQSINQELYYSTLIKPKVIAPCQNYNKVDIINYSIDNNLPVNLIKSCYNSSKISGAKHCGSCMSCKYLKNAIEKSKNPNLIKEIF